MNLKVGDTIGIISQSWCGPEKYPHVLEKGIETLKEMGFKVKEFPFTRKQGNPEERSRDLTKAILDEEVNAIFMSIGGDDCTFILQYLDTELLQKYKKPIMGYSDPTAILVFLYQQGFPCYYGPTMMAGFAQVNEYPEWRLYLEKTLKGESLPFIPFKEYNNGYEDWSQGVIKVKPKKKNDGFHFLNKLKGEGKLFGGNLEVLEFLKGTDYWPNKDFWNDKILFLETSDDALSITQIKYILRNYGFMGVLQRINGLIFGRARDFSAKKKAELEKMILSVLTEFDVSIPVVTNFDIGHTDPHFVLKYGEEVKILPESVEKVN